MAGGGDVKDSVINCTKLRSVASLSLKKETTKGVNFSWVDPRSKKLAD